MGFLSRDGLFHCAFWDLPLAACLDPAFNCNSTLNLKILQVPLSFLPVWLSFSLRALLTASCPLLMLIMLLGLSPSLYLGGVLLYSFLFAKNVHKSFFSQHLQEAEENGHLYCPAFACSASVWAVF